MVATEDIDTEQAIEEYGGVDKCGVVKDTNGCFAKCVEKRGAETETDYKVR